MRGHVLSIRCFAVAAALLSAAASGQVTVRTIYAVDVPTTAGWTNGPRAQNAPHGTCNDSQYATIASGSGYLDANLFQNYSLPAGHVVTRVEADVYCRYDAPSTNSQIRIHVDPDGSGWQLADSPTWSQSSTDASCRWRMGGNGRDITPMLGRPWTQADVNYVYVGVRRISGSGTLRVNSFRLIVTSEMDSDGDGIANSADPCPLDPFNDQDGDGRCGNADNCPATFNPDQANSDGDSQGDACDDDDDNDGVPDSADCSPNNAAAWRNHAYPDGDQDGICDSTSLVACPCFGVTPPAGFRLNWNGPDNCVGTFNPDQSNFDGDAAGNACDPDDDNDGIPDVYDNCPFATNSGQSDRDGDGIGDACDDGDEDGIPDVYDNCPNAFNPAQEDYDANGVGAECDPAENSRFAPVVGSLGPAGGGLFRDSCNHFEPVDGVVSTYVVAPRGWGADVQSGGGLLGFRVQASATVQAAGAIWTVYASYRNEGHYDGGIDEQTGGPCHLQEADVFASILASVWVTTRSTYRVSGDRHGWSLQGERGRAGSTVEPGNYQLYVAGNGAATIVFGPPCSSDLDDDGWCDADDNCPMTPNDDQADADGDGVGDVCERCIADANADGGIDGADVTAFFETWERGEAAADVNEDGGVDGADVVTFFDRWEAGGC